MTKQSVKTMLAQDMGRFYSDPLGFVMYAFPWDTEQSLQLVELQEPWASKYNCKYGPDVWACKLLDEIGRQVKERNFRGKDPVAAIRMAVVSGHGAGKSALTGWIVCWIMSTRPYAQGTVTANTGKQLETKTWAQIQKWMKLCITSQWFTVTATKIYQDDYPESWYCSAQTSREENSESFAGQHAANSTSFYINDEASAIPDIIHEVQQGGLTDGEPMIFAFGNGTRSTGWFREIWGKMRGRWTTWQVDSRTVAITNKQQIQEWIDDYGIDSDFVKVRVLGQFPSTSSLQFIPTDITEAAMVREASCALDDPLILGVDVARFGDDESVIAFRKGRDARTIPWLRYRQIDTMQLTAHIIQAYEAHRAQAIFVDEGGVGGGVVDRLRMMNIPVIGVNFGSKPGIGLANERNLYANKRAEIWGNMREWLRGGSIPDDAALRDDLIGIEYGFNNNQEILLEKKENMKKRGLASPDNGDALALTFSQPVMPIDNAGFPMAGMYSATSSYVTEYNPFDHM